ncbi:GNAT family N-acetyltransferase [Clostridium sp. UBA3061]|uniref:GNAT family N-acetyltransferase n=1 Tax=Clostridium sp. UBA3061 TaxID=1946353 RepID=UPI0032173500
MNIKIEKNCDNVDWSLIPEILKLGGMRYFDEATHKKAFENSYIAIFVYDNDNLIGFGRALSDGVYQGAIYDVAILPQYQGKGIGKLIVSTILESLPGCNVILYAAMGKEGFYNSFNFRKMKTGMALFNNAENMKEKGFIE